MANIPLSLNPENVIDALPVQTGSNLLFFEELSDKDKNCT